MYIMRKTFLTCFRLNFLQNPPVNLILPTSIIIHSHTLKCVLKLCWGHLPDFVVLLPYTTRFLPMTPPTPPILLLQNIMLKF